MNMENIQRLVDILNETPGISELSVTAPDGSKIALRRAFPAASRATGLVTAPREDLEDEDILEAESETDGGEGAPKLYTVTANIVGIFHCANPGLSFGSTVSAGQIVGYIESMKLMNEVTTSQGGVIAEVLIDENLPVEYGQPLFRLTSSPGS